MLQSENLILRPLKSTDLLLINIWRNDFQLNKLTLGIRFPKSLEMDEQWLNKALSDISNKNVYLAIDELQTSEFIGIVQLSNIDWISRTADFGVNIGNRTKVGKGYGNECIKLFFKYVFQNLNLRKINLKVVQFNDNAIRLYKNIGFQQEGLLKQEVFYENVYHDVIQMSLFSENFTIK